MNQDQWIDPMVALLVMLEGWQDAAPEQKRAWTLERYPDRLRVQDRAYHLVLREDARPEGERFIASCTDTRLGMLLAWLSPHTGINGAEWMRLYSARLRSYGQEPEPPREPPVIEKTP